MDDITIDDVRDYQASLQKHDAVTKPEEWFAEQTEWVDYWEEHDVFEEEKEAQVTATGS